MVVRFRSWWQKIKQHWVAIAVTTAIILVLALLMVCIWFNGTGFNGYTQVSTIRTLTGPTDGTVTRTETNQPGKTLWDLMQLLIIPVVLAVAGFWFNHRERKAAELRAENERKAAALHTEAEQEIEQQRAKTERLIAQDNQRQSTLETYIDKMSELLLEKHLRDSPSTDEVRTLARVRTLTTLSRLDGERKKTLTLFLKEAGLMKKDEGNIDLVDADLSDAKLSNENLKFVNLRGAYLSNADLSRAKLFGADLSHIFSVNANLSYTELMNADLSGAELIGADLSGANLTGACLANTSLFRANLKGVIGISSEELVEQASSLTKATMPDGSIHP
jgi:uncharacterized protein YjbI with pentapeptide repeats